MDTRQLPARCAICSSPGAFLWAKGEQRVYKCLACGFRFAHPVPDLPLRDDFSHARVILDSPDHFRSEYNRFLARVESMTVVGKLLDIGCNIGLSLVVAQERGWAPLGIELSLEAAQYGREKFGIEIIETPLEEAGLSEGEFDAVVMYHTLEHVLHPLQMLSDVARVLKPGGVLYISVPNSGGISSFLLREKWEWVSQEHVSYFDRGSLRLALEKVGLVPMIITSCLGARVAKAKPRWEAQFIDRISNVLCLSISLESWSKKLPALHRFNAAAE